MHVIHKNLSVGILDVNDNPPKFEANFLEIELPITSTVNSTVYQLIATDSDDEENSRITYKINLFYPVKAQQYFAFDQNTGKKYIIFFILTY